MYREEFIRDIRDAARFSDLRAARYDTYPSNPMNDMQERDVMSSKPRSVVIIANPDPVNCIAMQNAIAQPGGGACPIFRPNVVSAQFNGVMDKVQAHAPLIFNNTRTVNGYPRSSQRQSISGTQNYYFNSGTRAEGMSLYVGEANTGHDFGLMQNERRCCKRNAGKEKFKRVQSAIDGASVVWGGTGLCNVAYRPFGSGSSKARPMGMHTPTGADTSDNQPMTLPAIPIEASSQDVKAQASETLIRRTRHGGMQ